MSHSRALRAEIVQCRAVLSAVPLMDGSGIGAGQTTSLETDVGRAVGRVEGSPCAGQRANMCLVSAPLTLPLTLH